MSQEQSIEQLAIDPFPNPHSYQVVIHEGDNDFGLNLKKNSDEQAQDGFIELECEKPSEVQPQESLNQENDSNIQVLHYLTNTLPKQDQKPDNEEEQKLDITSNQQNQSIQNNQEEHTLTTNINLNSPNPNVNVQSLDQEEKLLHREVQTQANTSGYKKFFQDLIQSQIFQAPYWLFMKILALIIRQISTKVDKQKEEKQNIQFVPEENPNVLFFQGKLKGSNGLTIHELLKKVRDYEYLERRHDYIQWLFPNLFMSAFNSSSYCLNQNEVEIMHKDDSIRKTYIRGLKLFLDFLGLEITYSNEAYINHSKENMITKTNEDNVQITKTNEDRLYNALIINTHNHLRIRRILASLIALNFNDEAQAFCQFLKNEELSQELYDHIYKYYDQNEKSFLKEYVWPKNI